MKDKGSSITRDAWYQLIGIRESGSVNMADRFSVQSLARMIGADELADWIRDNDRESYANLLVFGPVFVDAITERGEA